HGSLQLANGCAFRELLEGNSLRSTARLTRTARNTVMATMVEAGEECQVFLDSLRRLPAEDVQADEIWSFVGCKEKTKVRMGYGEREGTPLTNEEIRAASDA